jgi:arylsulfatase A-like enzyme
MARTNPDGTLKKNSYTSNLPLRDGKGLMYEGGLRVPYIFYWKGKIEAGTVNSETPVTGIDLYPTFLEIAEIPKPENQIFDGVSIAKCLFDTEFNLPERPLFWHYPNYGPASMRKGKVYYGYIPTDVLRLGDYKLIEFYHDKIDHIELYNLKDDIGERNDLSKKMPEKVKQLQEIMHNLQKESNARMPVPNPE